MLIDVTAAIGFLLWLKDLQAEATVKHSNRPFQFINVLRISAVVPIILAISVYAYYSIAYSFLDPLAAWFALQIRHLYLPGTKVDLRYLLFHIPVLFSVLYLSIRTMLPINWRNGKIRVFLLTSFVGSVSIVMETAVECYFNPAAYRILYERRVGIGNIDIYDQRQGLFPRIEEGDHEGVIRFVAAHSLRPVDLRMALYASFSIKDKELAEYFIRRGANINGAERKGNDTLLLSFMNVAGSPVPEWLLEWGVRIDERGILGETPLMIAIDGLWRNIPLAEKLLAKTPTKEIDAIDNNGYTALHHAALVGQLTMAQLLVARGANVHARAKDGTTPIDIAKLHNYPVLEKFLLSHHADKQRLQN